MMLQRRYRLERLIGAGTTSEVWQGHDELLRRQVAVRLLRADRADLAERFLAEGHAAARLTHANVAAVYDVGTVELPDRGDVPYVVMELVVGPTVEERLRHAPLGWDEVAQIGAEVGAALAHAHGQWVTHGALTAGKVALTDVGAKVFGFTDRRGTDPHDVSLDVHALGALLHNALITAPLDRAASDRAALDRAASDRAASDRAASDLGSFDAVPEGEPLDFAPLRFAPVDLVPDLAALRLVAPPELVTLIGRCLDPEPARRPGSDETALTFSGIAGTRVDLPAWFTMSAGGGPAASTADLEAVPGRHAPGRKSPLRRPSAVPRAVPPVRLRRGGATPAPAPAQRAWIRPPVQPSPALGARPGSPARTALSRLPFGVPSRSGARLNDVTFVDLRTSRAARPPQPATGAGRGRRWAVRAVVGSVIAGIVSLAAVAAFGQAQRAEGIPGTDSSLQTATTGPSPASTPSTEAPAVPAATASPTRTRPATRPPTTRPSSTRPSTSPPASTSASPSTSTEASPSASASASPSGSASPSASPSSSPAASADAVPAASASPSDP